jgi:hypothetical protein
MVSLLPVALATPLEPTSIRPVFAVGGQENAAPDAPPADSGPLGYRSPRRSSPPAWAAAVRIGATLGEPHVRSHSPSRVPLVGHRGSPSGGRRASLVPPGAPRSHAASDPRRSLTRLTRLGTSGRCPGGARRGGRHGGVLSLHEARHPSTFEAGHGPVHTTGRSEKGTAVCQGTE